MQEAEQQYLEAYQEYADPIFRYCFWKVSNREVAKDLTQEVFVKTWNYLVKGECIDNYKAFLYRTAHNIVVDHYRLHTSESLDLLQEKGFDPGEDTVESLIDTLDGAHIMKLVGSLSREYQDVIQMRYSQGLSHAEIAEVLGEGEGVIRVRAHRGMKKLRELVSRLSGPLED